MGKELKPFSVKHSYPIFDKLLLKPMVPILDHAFALSILNKGYTKNAHHQHTPDFAKGLIQHWKLVSRYNKEELDNVPEEGGCIITANHPTGLAETMLLYDMLCTKRTDIKFLTTPLLEKAERVQDITIIMDNLDTKAARSRNIKAIRESTQWLKDGHILVIFPAGEVSHYKFEEKQIMDSQWSSLPITLNKRSGAPILPVHCQAKNGWAFHAAGFIHPMLRTVLLPRALKKQGNKVMDITIGHPIPKAALSDADPKEAAEWLRKLTYTLPFQKLAATAFTSNKKEVSLQPLAPRVEQDALLAELNALPPETKLHTYRNFTCYAAPGKELNLIMQEIGRAREETFRLVGEGTGEPSDIDQYDNHYYQLFVWDHKANKLVGGYRMGFIDHILDKQGAEGIYLNGFYHNVLDILPKDGKCADVGRSFITPEYQSQYQALLLLWQGIGRLLVRNPGYRYLFGLVSLSQEVLTPFAIRFLIACLRHGAFRSSEETGKPKVPFRGDYNLPKSLQKLAALPLSFNQIKHTVESLEHKKMQVPILLKHYCQQLRSRCINFSVDPDFGECVDVLIMTDMASVKDQLLARYIGRDNLQAYKAQFND